MTTIIICRPHPFMSTMGFAPTGFVVAYYHCSSIGRSWRTRSSIVFKSIGVTRMKNWSGQKWTSELNDHISGFIYMVLRSRNVFQMSIFTKLLSTVLHCVHWYMYMFIYNKLGYR